MLLFLLLVLLPPRPRTSLNYQTIASTVRCNGYHGAWRWDAAFLCCGRKSLRKLFMA
jgi:hypothetical protein